MAIDLKRRGFASEVLGVEAEPVNAAAAEKIGLVDRVVSFEQCLEEADLVVLAVPVGTAVKMLPVVLDSFQTEPSKVVIDVCSTKEQLAQCVKDHPARSRYVGTHPMAGTEYSGPWAALPCLFDGHAGIICDAAEVDPEAVKVVEKRLSLLPRVTV